MKTRSFFRLWLPLCCTILFLSLFLIKTTYESKRVLHETVTFKPTGASVRVDLAGEKVASSGTLIFLPGLNESYGVFLPLQKKLSPTLRSFLYDRNQLNRPRTPENPRSVLTQVEDLHQLLTQLHIKPPYLLVAHSIGGFHASIFATKYTREVLGVLLIESSYELQSWNPKTIAATGELNYSEILQSAAMVRSLRKADALRNIPLVVLTADYKNRSFPYYSYWLANQKKLASLSRQSKHIIVSNSGHLIPSEHPEAVESGIKELLSLIETR